MRIIKVFFLAFAGLACGNCGSYKPAGIDSPSSAVQDIAVFPQTGHASRITAAAYSNDGKYVVTGSRDGVIKIWDARNGRELRTFTGHTSDDVNGISALAYSPDGRYIASGAADETIKIWDIEAGRLARTIAEHGFIISAVTYSPDGQQIASASLDGTLSIWDAATGRELHILFGHEGGALSAAYSPDGKRLVSGSADGSIKIWDTETGKETSVLSGITDDVNAVTFSPDGEQIAAGSGSGHIRIWNAGTGRTILDFSGHDNRINYIAYSPDGKRILSSSQDKTFKVFDAANGRSLLTVSQKPPGKENENTTEVFYGGGRGPGYGVIFAAYSHDGRHIVSCSRDFTTVKIWDAESGKEVQNFSSYNDRINYVLYHPAKARILSVSMDNVIREWDAENGKPLWTNSGYDEITSIVYSPGGNQMLLVSKNIARVLDSETGKETSYFSGMAYELQSALYSPDGKRIVFAFSNSFVFWDIAKEKMLDGLWSQEQPVVYDPDDQAELRFRDKPIVYSPDGKLIAFPEGGIGTSIISICDAETGKKLRTIEHEIDGLIRQLAFSPDGKNILAGFLNMFGGTAAIWDVKSGTHVRTLYEGYYLSSLTYSPDGKQVLYSSGLGDNNIHICDTETGKEMGVLSGHGGSITSLLYSPDGKKMLSGSEDGTIRVRDMEQGVSGKEIARFASFSGADTQIASATRDIAVEEIAEKAASIDGEWIAITPDGYYQASPRGDRYLNVRVGNTVSGIDSYRSVFYNPELVRARLAGRPDPASKADVTIQDAASFTPPVVTVRAANTTTTTGTADISVTVSDKNRPVKNIKVLVNGTLLGREDLRKARGRGLGPEKTSFTVTGDLKEVTFRLPVPLEPGENTIEVTAFNGYTDSRSSAAVTWRTNQRLPPPNLRILAIGVNKYDDSRIRSLNYCVSDARGIIDSFEAQAGKHYARVDSLLIADGAAITPTAANIRDKLKWLDQAGPRDVIILFLAGHGITAGNNFYFLPKDASLTTGNTLDTAKAISDRDILSVLDAPGKRLIFIDACQSGGVDGNLMTRVLMESNGLVFTAAQGSERSSEFEDLKHGIFTYSIMEGLRGKYNTRGAKDIKILPLSVSVADYVSKEVERRTRETREPLSQNPKVYSLGFPELTIAETP